MKHKAFGISLLVCLLAPATSAFVYFQFQKAMVRRDIKHRMIAGMDRGELVLLKFTTEESEKDLYWEHEREFEYRGDMYDVVERRAIGDSLYYWCWPDREETRLNNRLDELTAFALNNTPRKNNQQRRLAVFYKNLYFPYAADDPLLPDEKTVEGIPFSEAYSAIHLSPPKPPPRIVG